LSLQGLGTIIIDSLDLLSLSIIDLLLSSKLIDVGIILEFKSIVCISFCLKILVSILKLGSKSILGVSNSTRYL